MFFRRQNFSQSELLPNWTCGHFWMAKVWLPNWLKLFSTFRSSTRMAVITTMMENTPINTPSSVSAERSMCASDGVQGHGKALADFGEQQSWAVLS